MTELSEAAAPSVIDGIGLDNLALHVQAQLACLCYPPANWVANAQDSAAASTDVLIVGGGMCGMLAWFALRQAGIHNVRIIDQSPEGQEGPWLNYARMETLRSPKQLAGPAYGMGTLTFQSWFRARFGAQDWEALDKIPRPMWMDYLRWYRQVLQIPIENDVKLAKVAPSDSYLRLTLEHERAYGDRSGGMRRGTQGCTQKGGHESEHKDELADDKNSRKETLTARKLIYATGRDGIAKANIPHFVQALPTSRWAHSSHDIDFTALKGKRVAVVGVGASAVDNAAEALEAGASEVRHLVRRKHMPTINKMMGIGSFGFVAGYSDLPDEWRWRFMQYSFATQTPSPRGSTMRVSQHENAYFHFGKNISAIAESNNELLIEFDDGSRLTTDHVILGTGFSTDPLARVELGEAAARILLWQDVYTPPEDENNADLGRFPYLAEDFTFREKTPGDAPWLKHVYCFNYGATASMGKVSGDIPGISEGARWLSKALASSLYREDIDMHWQNMQNYDKPELQGDEWTSSELPGEPFGVKNSADSSIETTNSNIERTSIENAG